MNYRTEYQCYKNMIYRCTKSTYIRYKDYGGRGIAVCERWLFSFDNFISDMGARPSKNHSLDRIKNDGNYEPDNCRWTVRLIQMNNKHQTVIYSDRIINIVKSEIEKGTAIKEIASMVPMSKGAINHYRYKIRGINYKKGINK